MRIEVGVGDLMQRIGDDQAQVVEYSVARRSGGRLTPYVIHIIHVEEMKTTDFLVEAQTGGDGLVICAAKSL
jgi:hypothetical protein